MIETECFVYLLLILLTWWKCSTFSHPTIYRECEWSKATMLHLEDTAIAVSFLFFFVLYITLWECHLEVPTGVWFKSPYIKKCLLALDFKMPVWTDCHILLRCYYWVNKYRMGCCHSTVVKRNLNNHRDFALPLFWKTEKFLANIYFFSYVGWEPNETLCAICYHLYNLKYVKNMHGGLLLLLKLLALACDFIKSNTPPGLFFVFFKLYKW